ncbi:MAG: DUF4382 domain-containing protein [Thiohalomonadales bacterium]
MQYINKIRSLWELPHSQNREPQTRTSRLLTMSCIGIAAIALSACAPDDTGSVAGDNTGELILGLTDAAGDFSHYNVDVTQITLTKLNGAVVRVLPVTTQVDFAQYTEMTEFLTAAMIPAGVYNKATLSLDYSNADIWLEDNSGTDVKVATILDSEANPVTTMDVSVRLEGRNRLAIVAGVPAHMTLDFDLDASNSVEFDVNDIPTITVEPYLLADLEFEVPRIHRVRGPLARVNIDRQAFAVIIRPFRHLQNNDKRFGTLAVKVSEDTVYDINDMDYVGSTGLDALDALPALAATVVVGDLKFNPRRFVAREVYAGSSVAGGSMDVVKGTVVARAGDSLTVRGATLIRAGGSVVFRATVNVDIAATTRVKKQGSVEPATSDDISVGQSVTIFGSLSNDVATELTMNATAGLVRLKVTNIRGTSVAQIVDPAVTAPFAINLRRMARLKAAAFDFTGTGSETRFDADPLNYEIATAGLDLSAIADSTPVLVKGFVRAFAQAPEDFDAISVTDFSNLPASMAISWDPATVTPFTRSSDIDAVINVEGLGRFHHIGQAGGRIDINDLSTAPTLVAPTDGKSRFVIVEDGTHQLFDSIGAWVTAMDERIENGSLVKGLKAKGRLDLASVEMTIRQVILLMGQADGVPLN